MPEQDIDQPQQEGQQQGQQKEYQQGQIDWENEANPYKKRYMDSQSQVTPLVNTLKNFAEYDYNTKTWRQKTQQQIQQEPVDFDKVFSGYDPEFSGNLKKVLSPIQQEIKTLREERAQSFFLDNYNRSVTSARSRTIEEFGEEYDFAKDGKFNANSPLYKMADEILRSKYARFNTDGTFHSYSTPEAEYLSTVEAYAIMQRRSKQSTNLSKSRLGAIQGKGTTGGSSKKNLTYEEYSKLSGEEKDAYDMAQIGE